MSKEFAVKIFAPLAVSASIVTAAIMMSSAPPAHAEIPVSPPAQAITTMTPSLAPMLKQVMPGVVNISVTGAVEVENPYGPMMNDPLFRRFFGVPEQPQEREFQSIGSGVIVDAKKGYVLTNNHVVDKAKDIKIRLNDDREFTATLVGHDPDTDLAVLQFEADNLTAVPMGSSDALQVGDFVVAIGSPFNLRQTVTSGIVSALGRIGVGDGIGAFIQTDASINPGNSGGALVDLHGQLVGIPSMIFSKSGGNIGIGFAIPIDQAKSIMNQLIEFGGVQRGQIGITGQNLTPDLAKAFGIEETRGAVVTRVLPDSPAEKAGVEAEDIIVEANGKAIENFDELRTVVGLMRVGDTVKLKVRRDGKLKTLKVEIGEREEVAANGDNLHSALQGATFAAVDRNNPVAGIDSGIQVQTIAHGSPAARSGLQPGDVIVSVNRKPVDSIDTFSKLATGDGQLLLRVRRGQAGLFLLLQ